MSMAKKKPILDEIFSECMELEDGTHCDILMPDGDEVENEEDSENEDEGEDQED